VFHVGPRHPLSENFGSTSGRPACPCFSCSTGMGACPFSSSAPFSGPNNHRPKAVSLGPVSQLNNSRLVPATSPIPPPKPNTTSRQGTHVAPSTTCHRSSVSMSGLSYTSGSSLSSPLVQPMSAKTKKKRGKFYVVTKGRAVGVFDHW